LVGGDDVWYAETRYPIRYDQLSNCVCGYIIERPNLGPPRKTVDDVACISTYRNPFDGGNGPTRSRWM